ncbi:MAG: hypothetical protein JO107_16305 [Hyphomicrobiales bacterium]|nr:hypothetical protein [Hyphomicrobiales bacterium]
MTPIDDLIARLEKATGPDRGIDAALDALSPYGDEAARYTASIDAAVALIERVMMDARWDVSLRRGSASAEISLPSGESQWAITFTPALALCLARAGACIAITTRWPKQRRRLPPPSAPATSERRRYERS